MMWTLLDENNLILFELDFNLLEQWNQFLYRNATQQDYKKNYLFFLSSSDSFFSKEEILNSCQLFISYEKDFLEEKNLFSYDKTFLVKNIKDLKKLVCASQSERFRMVCS